MPFFLLSAAASRPLASLLCVCCPCVRVWFCPCCSAPSPPVSTSLSLLVVCGPSRVLFVSGRVSCVLSRAVGAPVCCLWVEFVFFIWRYSVTMVLGVFTSSPRCASAFVSLALVVSWFLVVCWWVPFSVLFCRGLRGEVGPASEPWTGLHCSEFHWRCPVELPALQSRAPASSKACTHGSFSTDAAALRLWHFEMSAQ